MKVRVLHSGMEHKKIIWLSGKYATRVEITAVIKNCSNYSSEW